MNYDKMSLIIGKNIQSARLVKGLTQEQLSEKCNVSPNHISSVENENSNCSFSLMLSICNVLDVTPNYIFADFIFSKNDTIETMDKNLLLTYLKLKPQSKKFINNAINEVYKIQKQR